MAESGYMYSKAFLLSGFLSAFPLILNFIVMSMFVSSKCLYDNYKIILIEIASLIVLAVLLLLCSFKHNKLFKHDI